MVRSSSFFAVGLVLLGTLAPSSAPAADPKCPYGVNAHQASNEALDLTAAAGIAWVRFDLNWFQFEPEQGNFQWNEADRFVDHATSLGMSVFMTAAYTPSWASAVPCNEADPDNHNWCHNAPPVSSSWTSFVTAAVNRYGSKVKAWGMWNEPNLLDFYRGTRDQYVTDILVPGSAAVHAACSDCLVLGPELSNLRSADWDGDKGECYPTLGCRFNAWEYSLTKILEAAAGSLDIISHHKYHDPANELLKELVDGVYEGPLQVNHGLKVITDAKAPGKPVWLTEFGWESEPGGNKTNVYAAEQLTAAYQGLPALRAGTLPNTKNQPWPELQKLFWYDLQNDPNGPSWGLLDSTLAKKAPYDAYAAVITAQGPCETGGAAGSAGAAGAAGQGGAGGEGGGGSGGAGPAGAAGTGGFAGQGGFQDASVGGKAGTSPTDASTYQEGAVSDTSTQDSAPPSAQPASTEDSGCGCSAVGRNGSSWIGLLCSLAAWIGILALRRKT